MSHVSANIIQSDFRWRNDNGLEVTATYTEALNTNTVIDVSNDVNVRLRLRAVIEETAGGSTNNRSLEIWVSKNSGAYARLTTVGTDVKVGNSPNIGTTLNDTTQQLSSGTFIMDNNYLVDNVDTSGNCSYSGNDKAEVEWTVEFVGSQLVDGDTFDFQFRQSGGGSLDNYTNTPRATIFKDIGPILVLGSFSA